MDEELLKNDPLYTFWLRDLSSKTMAVISQRCERQVLPYLECVDEEGPLSQRCKSLWFSPQLQSCAGGVKGTANTQQAMYMEVLRRQGACASGSREECEANARDFFEKSFPCPSTDVTERLNRVIPQSRERMVNPDIPLEIDCLTTAASDRMINALAHKCQKEILPFIECVETEGPSSERCKSLWFTSPELNQCRNAVVKDVNGLVTIYAMMSKTREVCASNPPEVCEQLLGRYLNTVFGETEMTEVTKRLMDAVAAAANANKK